MNTVLRVLLLLIAALLAVAFVNSRGTGDVNFYWLQWMQNADIVGPVEGYVVSSSDYPPLTHVILFTIARISRPLALTPFLGLKWSMVLMLFASAAVFGAWTRDLLAPAVLILVLLLNSVALGYLDIWTAPFLIGAMWALERHRLVPFAILFSLAVWIKWQPLIIAPFLLIYLFRVYPWKGIRRVIPPTLFIAAGFFATFSVGQVYRALDRALHHTMVSGNALNLGWIVTYFLHVIWPATFGRWAAGSADYIYIESSRTVTLAKIPFDLAYLVVLALFWKTRPTFEHLIAFSLFGYLTYFTWNVGVHENHLFLACLLGAILWRLNPDWRLTFAAWAAAANINLLLFYGLDGSGLPFSRVAGGLELSVWLAVVNVALYGIFAWVVTQFDLGR